MATLESYIAACGEPVKAFCAAHLADFEKGIPTHPGSQKLAGGKRLHTVQVIEKALALNQSCDRVELIEACLVHDLKGCEALPLTACQRMAIAATKGSAAYKDWRHTPCYKFVVLVLIADMWSAFINENDLA